MQLDLRGYIYIGYYTAIYGQFSKNVHFLVRALHFQLIFFYHFLHKISYAVLF